MSEMPPSYTPPPPPPPGGSYTPPPPPPPPPVGGGAAPGSDRTLMIVLSYLGLLALIPLLTKKEDPDVQWHAKNGLALTIAWVVVWIVWQIISFALARMFGPLACFGALAGCLIGIAFLVVDIMAMIKGINGQRMRIPVITDMAEKM